MAKAKYGDSVQVHYEGTLDDGTVFDSSGENESLAFGPLEFVIGQGEELLPGFQKALVGLEPGESITIRIACEDAYGPRFEELVKEIERSVIQPKTELFDDWRWPNGKGLVGFNIKKGDKIEVPGWDDGYVPAIVTKVTDSAITFDANHPLAGLDLNFAIKLVNIL